MRVRFHLPDFTRHFRLNVTFAEMLKRRPEFFREGVEIASVYGAFPPSMWNGGRFQEGICEEGFIKQVISTFNNRNIPLRFTFTNPMLTEEHLSDPFCNMVMQLADNGMNEAIVMSPLLEDYIRKNYPGYKLTSSTCKRITDPEALYSEVGSDYHIVVIDYDLNHDMETLEKIPDKKKCEILVNACCNPGCKYRSDHYRYIGEEQILYAQHVSRRTGKPFDFAGYEEAHPEYRPVYECKCMERTVFDIKGLKNFISPEDIWEKYVPMGFEQFKIEGRSLGLFSLIEHYMYYMIKPERRDEARLTLLRQLENNGTVQIR
ncbi:MAG TPA: hypothetical protein DCZ71_06420 [Ruminococcus sp.]|nr:hypothetical protein [Ruminococcus sp.]